MSEEALLDAARFGAILGVGLGIVLGSVIRQVVREFKFWRRSLERSRQTRCMRDWR